MAEETFWKLVCLGLGLFIAYKKLGLWCRSESLAAIGLLPEDRALAGRSQGELSAADGAAGAHADGWSASRAALDMGRGEPRSWTAGDRGSAGRLLGVNEHDEGEHAGREDDGHGETCGGGHGHPHEAIFFLSGAIAVGALITSLMTLPAFHGAKWLQQTVVLFVVGLAYSSLMQGVGLKHHVGGIGRSYSMWMCIDPHLLLYTMLPPLLAGDAMTIDTRVAFKVAKQCLFLAGPGVLINGVLTALVLQALPHGWPWWLCMVCGSILCATDPVAVVSLLKELGASPTLTVQIQGESLLNDGTAIVLFSVAYSFLSSDTYSDPGKLIFKVMSMTLYSWGVGFFIGCVYWLWIKVVKNNFHHQGAMIQVSLTLACAYSSFLVSEGLLHLSGVLATVSSSMVLAHLMWPDVQCKETMHTVWHMFEYLGNTVIFFLAGALTGNAIWKMPWGDWMRLMMIYVAITMIRGGIIFTFRPVLTNLHEDKADVTIADGLVMCWGGLRGAVGLALAIQVSVERAVDDDGREHISEEDANRVLFYVGGVALLTLIVNATTCPTLVNKLGLTRTTEAKRQLISMIYRKMERLAHRPQLEPKVTQSLDDMLHSISNHWSNCCDDSEGSGSEKSPTRKSLMNFRTQHVGLSGMPTVHRVIDENPNLIWQQFADAQNLWHSVDREDQQAFQQLFGMEYPRVQRAFETMSQHSTELFEDLKGSRGKPDADLIRALIEAFLNILKSEYQSQREDGLVSTDEAKLLIDSITAAKVTPAFDLRDFRYMCESPGLAWSASAHAGFQESEKGTLGEGDKVMTEDERRKWSRILKRLPLRLLEEDAMPTSTSCVLRLVEGSAFNGAIVFLVLANTILINVEEIISEGNGDDIGWFALEIAFNVFFAIELFLKLLAWKTGFFLKRRQARRSKIRAWNVFDFVLVVVGWTGIIAQLALENQVGSQQAQLAKGARAIRALRALRVVRLFRLVQDFHHRLMTRNTAYYSVRIQEGMHRLSIVMAIIKAHAVSQHTLLEYFGCCEEERCDGLQGSDTYAGNMPEVSRCILQSMTTVYHAMVIGAFERRLLPNWLIREKATCHEGIEATKKLEHFIDGATEGGVLNAKEAHGMVHVMHEHIKRYEQRLYTIRLGKLPEPERPSHEEPARAHADVGSAAVRRLSSLSRSRVRAPKDGTRTSLLGSPPEGSGGAGQEIWEKVDPDSSPPLHAQEFLAPAVDDSMAPAAAQSEGGSPRAVKPKKHAGAKKKAGQQARFASSPQQPRPEARGSLFDDDAIAGVKNAEVLNGATVKTHGVATPAKVAKAKRKPAASAAPQDGGGAVPRPQVVGSSSEQ